MWKIYEDEETRSFSTLPVVKAMVIHINISLDKLPTFMLEFDKVEKSNVACSLPPAYVVRGKVMFWHQSVCLSTLLGGVPGLRFFRGGPRSQIFRGGSPRSQIFGGVPGLRFWGGVEVPGLSKGKNFWHQIWLDTCSDWKKNFCQGTPPPPVKGKIFDTRFGLIHVQTGGKIFCWGTPPPPSVKGNIFDTRFGLFRLGKKNFVKGSPPCNSKKLLWLRGGRYASCVHAGGLSCWYLFSSELF